MIQLWCAKSFVSYDEDVNLNIYNVLFHDLSRISNDFCLEVVAGAMEQIVESIASGNVRAVTAERVIVTIERKVLRRGESVADAIAAGARLDASAVGGTHQSVGAEAARIAFAVGELRTGVHSAADVTARQFTRMSVTFFEDGAVDAAVDRAVVFGAPSGEVNVFVL